MFYFIVNNAVAVAAFTAAAVVAASDDDYLTLALGHFLLMDTCKNFLSRIFFLRFYLIFFTFENRCSLDDGLMKYLQL